MSDYISREAAIEALKEANNPILVRFVICKAAIEKVPAADVVEVVRCKDCKHRIVNENYGKRGYMKLEAMCDLDTGDCFQLGRCAEDDDWFCADGKRKDGAVE